MLNFDISGFGCCEIRYVVCDCNGTIALDGDVIDGVGDCFQRLSDQGVEVFVLTADIHGTASEKLSNLACTLEVIGKEKQAQQKQDFVQSLGLEQVFAVGNGANDQLMLKSSRIGVSVVGQEGLNTQALKNANIITNSITDALELLLNPTRLIATLKS